jgi:hypothetical protein
VGVNLHHLAEARSLALHRAIAEALKADPSLVETAQERMRAWRASGHISRPYAEAWLSILDRPLDELRRAITEDSETARALRQTTPFAGVIDPRTRWRIWDEVRARMVRGDGPGSRA